MKTVISTLSSVVVGFALATLLFTLKESNEQERHPLETEWTRIQNEFYRHYLVQKKHPTDLDFLSDASKDIIEIYKDQFRWDSDERTLHLTYSEPVKMRLGFFRQATALGTSISPNSVEHNAKLLQQAGKLEI